MEIGNQKMAKCHRRDALSLVMGKRSYCVRERKKRVVSQQMTQLLYSKSKKKNKVAESIWV
jgi:hypothetical protein